MAASDLAVILSACRTPVASFGGALKELSAADLGAIVVREAIARSGVVYAPGGAGTQQEIFTDTAQNSLTLQPVRSPMVFFGRDFYEQQHSELLAAVHCQASDFGWDELVTVTDSPSDVVDFVGRHDPDASGRAGIHRLRTHQGN